jgi:hypothetical protein
MQIELDCPLPVIGFLSGQSPESSAHLVARVPP